MRRVGGSVADERDGDDWAGDGNEDNAAVPIQGRLLRCSKREHAKRDLDGDVSTEHHQGKECDAHEQVPSLRALQSSETGEDKVADPSERPTWPPATQAPSRK
jgi:hypothetical protein